MPLACVEEVEKQREHSSGRRFTKADQTRRDGCRPSHKWGGDDPKWGCILTRIHVIFEPLSSLSRRSASLPVLTRNGPLGRSILSHRIGHLARRRKAAS